eukprot:g3944.t1
MSALVVALLGFLLAASSTTASPTTTTLSNGVVTLTLDDEGLTSMSDAYRSLTLTNDSFAVTLSDGSVFTPASCQRAGIPAAAARNATLRWVCSRSDPAGSLPVERFVDVAYELVGEGAGAFVSKVLSVSSSRPFSQTYGTFTIAAVELWSGIVLSSGGAAGGAAAAVPEWQVQKNTYSQQYDVAAFARFPASGWGAFLSIGNPFINLNIGAPSGGEPAAFNSPNCVVGQNHVADDLPGMPLEGLTARECEAKCGAEPRCIHYVSITKGCDNEPADGCYLKGNFSGTVANPCTCLASKPFKPLPPTPAPAPGPAPASASALFGSYAPMVTQDPSSPAPAHVTEPGVLGFTSLTKYYHAASGLNTGERLAFVACVESFHLDAPSRANRTVKVNVAWDENDYQVDVGTEAGRTEYKRIIDMNSELGVTHIVYEPFNSLLASRRNVTDGWGWEGSLWFSLGEQLREGAWHPSVDDVPADVLGMVEYARSKGVRLLAYAYPCLPFEAQADSVTGGALSLAPTRVQDWWIRTMLDFMRKTGAGGFAWDHDIFAGDASQRYAQWRGWMRILAALRAEFPGMVMDHRQTNHLWGPWYQLAGSYAEPIAGDENPETYGVPIASLHTDHVAADNTRLVNHRYAIEQLLPPSRIPGFIFHQTERTDDNGTNACFGGGQANQPCYDMNVRDFDLLGYKYGLLSTIGTAGQNNVVTMIPARDPEEFKLFPQADRAFIQAWLAFTDEHLDALRRTVPIATLGAPSIGAVDGTGAFTADGAEGFVFLFNPGMARANASLSIDESLGLANGTAAYTVEELYPGGSLALPLPVGIWAQEQQVQVAVGGSDARVLRFTKRAVPAAAETTAPLVLPICQQPSVYHAMPIAPGAVAPPGFAGGWFNVSFQVPAEIATQLAARKAAYPITWLPHEYNATWLVPSRLLLNVFISKPADSLDIHAMVDGKPVALGRSYNSRGLVRPRCFLGFYLDATELAASTATHEIAVQLPTLSKGAFQGLFWHNIETEASELLKC